MKKLIILALITLVTASMCADEIKLKYSSVTGEDVPMVREYMEFFRKAMTEIHKQWEPGKNLNSITEKYLDNFDDRTLMKIVYYDIKIKIYHKKFWAEMNYINSNYEGALRPNLYSADELRSLMLNPNTIIEMQQRGRNILRNLPKISSIRGKLWRRFIKSNNNYIMLSVLQRYDYWALVQLENYTESDKYGRTLHNKFKVLETPFNLLENHEVEIDIVMQNDLRKFEIGEIYLINYDYRFVKTTDVSPNENSEVFINDSYISNSTAIYDISGGKPKIYPPIYPEGVIYATMGEALDEYVTKYNNYEEMFEKMRELLRDLEREVLCDQ